MEVNVYYLMVAKGWMEISTYIPRMNSVLNATFQTPFEYAGYQTQISFMISETMRSAPYTMDIVFEINGMVIGTYSMVDSPQGSSVMSVINFTMPILDAGAENTFGCE